MQTLNKCIHGLLLEILLQVMCICESYSRIFSMKMICQTYCNIILFVCTRNQSWSCNNFWIGEGKSTDEEINCGMQDAVPNADCGTIQGLPKNATKINCNRMKANNWQQKRKQCDFELPRACPNKNMWTDSKACITDEKGIQDGWKL